LFKIIAFFDSAVCSSVFLARLHPSALKKNYIIGYKFSLTSPENGVLEKTRFLDIVFWLRV